MPVHLAHPNSKPGKSSTPDHIRSMIAEEPELGFVEEKCAPESEGGLEAIIRAGESSAHLDEDDFAVRDQPGQLLPLQPATQKTLDHRGL